jgi:hypothetical protein
MHSLLAISFSQLNQRLDSLEKNVIGAIDSHQNQDIARLTNQLEEKE